MKKKKGRGGDIYDRIRKRGDFGLWLDWCMNNEDYEFGRIGLNEIRKRINEYVKDGKINEAMELNQGLYRDYLKWLAPRYFDEYMIYLEIDRPPAERFYAPRRQILKQITDVLQDLVDDKLDEVFLHCPPRVGKLLSDDTPILTTKGWKRHGDLEVGDYVFSPEGKPIMVIAVHPKYHTTHTVTMSDGSKFDCHFRHEWKVYDRHAQKEKIIETQEMIGKVKSPDKHYRYLLPLKKPLEGVKKNLKVKPYTMGAWLGDGSNKNPRITGHKDDFAIIERVIADGYDLKQTYTAGNTNTYVFDKLRFDLQKYGMCHSRKISEKHIPADYLVAPIEDRLQLLAGLLDTDGTLRAKERRYCFTTVEKSLRDDFITLINSFGWRPCVVKYEPRESSSGVKGKTPYYVIGFNPTMEIPCVLERKQLKEFSKQRRISIRDISESEHKQGNCISVEGGMYLAGKTLTPTHNTTIMLFFLTWLAGRSPELSNLYSAYSSGITGAMYNGVMEIVNDPVTYKWAEIFPGVDIVKKDGLETTIDFGRKKRYPTITCRSVHGTLNGQCDARGVLISDDLIEGIEEANNKDRLAKAWQIVDNNLITRAKERCKIVWMGTRWSLFDPPGVRLDLLDGNEKYKSRRYKVINLPALDENGNSNFDYKKPCEEGFSTEYYEQRRASFEQNNDMASWSAQYMQEPIEREGALFTPETMRYYNGVLPEGKPDRVFGAVDVAFGGGDYVAMPVAYQFGDDVYIADVVFSDSDKSVTEPMVAEKVIKHRMTALEIEANAGGDAYKEDVEQLLKDAGYRLNIMSKRANNQKAKEIRILDKAPEIREFYFLDRNKRSVEYQNFMQQLFSFTVYGKNKHDDAPDSLSQLCEMIRGSSPIIKILEKRLW